MSEYQLGQLVGIALGAILGGALSYRLFKSKSKVARGIGLVIGALAIAQVAGGSIRFASGERVLFEDGFRKGCMRRCILGETVCKSYCDCQVKALLSRPGTVESMSRIRSAADVQPDQAALLQRIGMECTTPEMYDAKFMADCTQECDATDTNCLPRCRCLLSQLREGKDPQEGTRWLIENIESAQLSAAGELRMIDATAACLPPENASP